MNQPRTLIEAITFYSDPDRALEFMVAMRWPEGITCPRCNGADPYFLKSRRIWKCRECRRQFSIKVGTIMEDSPLSLGKWLSAMWLVANAKNSISSYELHRSLGITQKSAWFVLHRIREAMDGGSLEKLDGEVEVDETFIGANAAKMNHKARIRNKAKRPGTRGKIVAVAAVQRNGRTKSGTVRNTSRYELHAAVRESVESGATVYTDENASYDKLDEYTQLTVNHGKGEYVNGTTHTQNVENYFSLFKRCVKGTWVNVSPEHTDRYLAEQDFRYSERKKDDSTRARNVAGGVAGKRVTYRQLTQKRAGRGPAKGYDWRNHK